MKLKILEEARAQYREQSAWWREHRDAKSLFAQEFLAAIRHLRTTPETGTLYAKKRGRSIRRWLMPKTGYHVYYRFDRDNDVLIIYSVWGQLHGVRTLANSRRQSDLCHRRTWFEGPGAPVFS